MHDDSERIRGFKGVTLVEMVLAISMMTIILGAVLPLFAGIRNNWSTKQAHAEITQNARVLIDHLHRSLRQAVRITDVSASSAEAGHIEFVANDGSSYRYALDGDYAQFGAVGQLADLAGPMSQFQITCYDGNDFATPTVDLAAIRFVSVETVFPKPSPLGQDRKFVAGVFLRADPGIGDSVAFVPGAAVSDKIEIKDDGQIRAQNATAIVATNSTKKDKIKVKDDGVIDGDAYVGPGGDVENGIKLEGSGQITGATGVLEAAIDIPSVTMPSLGSSAGDLMFESGTTVISGDVCCDKLEIKNSAAVVISGAVSILAKKELTIKDNAQLKLLSGATLALYTNDKITIEQYAEVNVNTGDPSRLTIRHLKNKHFEVKSDSQVYATIIAPAAELKIKDDAKVTGTFYGRKIKIENNGRLNLAR